MNDIHDSEEELDNKANNDMDNYRDQFFAMLEDVIIISQGSDETCEN